MTLQEVIEEVRLWFAEGGEFESSWFAYGVYDIDLRIAIAKVLNAVAKGELK